MHRKQKKIKRRKKDGKKETIIGNRITAYTKLDKQKTKTKKTNPPKTP